MRPARNNNNPMAVSSPSFFRVLLLLAAAGVADALISVLEPNRKDFPSMVNEHLGQPLTNGFDYMGRLQYIDENPQLCPDKHGGHGKYDIVVPQDGLPVALLAAAGGCSIYDKLRFASALVNHANSVGFLIVQEGLETLKEYNSANGNNSNNNNMTEDDEPYLPIQLFSSMDSFGSELTGIDNVSDRRLDDGSAGGRLGGWIEDDLRASDEEEPTHRIKGSATSNLAVLQVSYETGKDILNLPFFPYRSHGGPRVLLNTKGNSVGTRTVILWMVMTFSCCACICACLLLCVHTAFEDDEPDPQPPRRPVRRRLTLDEVRERFPSYRYDPRGNEVLNGVGGSCCPTGGTDAEKFSLTGGAAPVAHHDYTAMPELDECTICLDEFVPGAKVRKLPCGHVFHSTCIARWLIERHANCPLCKLDLYIDPDEEEDDSDDGNEGESDADAEAAAQLSLVARMGLWWHGYTYIDDTTETLVVPTGSAEAAAEAVPGDEANNTAIEEDAEEPRSWWPFSLEIADPNGGEEEEEEGNDGAGPSGGASSSPLSAASTAVGAVARTWSTLLGGVRSRQNLRRRNRHHRRPTLGGGGTELTEPLVASGNEGATTAELPSVDSVHSNNSSNHSHDNNNNNNNTTTAEI